METTKTKGAPEIADAVFGYDYDGNIRFYLASEGAAWREDPSRFVTAHTSKCLRLCPKERPVLAVVREGEGLWFDEVEEWFERCARPNAWVAFTTTQALELIGRARTGDKVVALGSTSMAALFGGVA